jgi:hypothetical protein
MTERAHYQELFTHTGYFFFKVWRRNGAAWNWRLRVEVVETGEWQIFDSMQEALQFIRQHMTADADDDADVDLAPPTTGETTALPWDCLEEQAELVDWTGRLRHTPNR